MNYQTATKAIRRSPFLLVAAALVALAVLFVHGAQPASAQQSVELTLSAANPTVGEAAGSATVTVTMDRPAGAGGATVTLLPNPADGGTAALGRDYSLPDARATIAEGDTEASIRVTIKDDAVNEPNETVILTASCECDVDTVSANTVTLTIQDNEQDVRDPVETHSHWPRFNPQDFRVEPAGSSLVVTFGEHSARAQAWLRWREDSNPKWTTVKGVRSGHILNDLANGVLHHVELNLVSSTLRGNWTSTTATPSPQGDPPSSPSEMTLSVLGGADAVGEDVGIVTVLARVHGTAPEGGVTVTLNSLRGSSATAVEGRDYALPRSFTIAEGRSEASANIAIINDAVNEPDETIYLSATTDAAAVTTVAGLILTIRDDEPDLTPQGFVRMEKPTNLTLTPGNGRLEVEFGRPAGDVYEYWLQWRADDNPQWTTVRGGRITEINIYSKRHTADWNIYGLVNGVVHHVRVANVENPYSGFQQWSGWVEASATPTIISFPPGDEIIGKDYTSGTDVAAQDTWRRDAYHAGLSSWQDSGPLPEAVIETPGGASSVRVDYSATGLPAGLTLNDDRMIVGTPAVVTSRQRSVVVYSATATVINADGSQGPTYRAARTFTFEIFVNPPVAFSAETIESLRTSTAVYDVAKKKWLDAGDDGKVTLPAASGGAGGLTYGLYDERSRLLTEVTNITFDSETRKIGGTPTSLNTWAVTYWARDVNGVTAYAVTNVEVKRSGGL